MATKMNPASLCLVCLEAPADETIDTCGHSVCRTCYDKHKAQNWATFPCPACRKRSPEPTVVTQEGADAEPTCETGAVAGPSEPKRARLGSPVTEHRDRVTGRNICKICAHKGTCVRAANVCKACSSMPLCERCTADHAKKLATKSHKVTSLVAGEEDDTLCAKHDEPLNSFCCTCSVVACSVCVALEHGDHEVKSLGQVCIERMSEVKSGIESEEQRLEGLRRDERELVESKAVAVDMEDALIKAIEDHVEKSIEQILKNKDTLKKQVKKDFGVIWEMTKQLEAMPPLISESEQAIAKAKQLISDGDLRPRYLDQLRGSDAMKVFDELRTGQPHYASDMELWRTQFEEIKEKALTFYPKTPNSNIGGFQEPEQDALQAVCREKGYCVCETCGFKPSPDSERSSECDRNGFCTCGICAKNWTIPSVTNREKCNERNLCDCRVCNRSFLLRSRGGYWEYNYKGQIKIECRDCKKEILVKAQY